MMKRMAAVVAAVGLVVAALGVTVSASASAASGNVRIGGVSFSSLGKTVTVPEGEAQYQPGVENIILRNYGYSAKNLKGYRLVDKAGNVIPLCQHPKDPVLCNTEADALVIPARSQQAFDVETLHDGPFMNNGGDTLYLRNSVGKVVSTFVYKVS